MEFSDTATLVVNGRVQCDSNIYVGSPANLTFNSLVTCSGTISAPANAGYPTSSWTGSVIYNGSPAPGYVTNFGRIALPIGDVIAPPGVVSNFGFAMQQILYPRPVLSARLVVRRSVLPGPGTLLEQSTHDSRGEQYFFTATFKSAAGDPAPYVFSTNLTWLGSTNAGATNWSWLTTTNTFYEWRERKTVNLTQIDVGKLTNWMATFLMTNSATATKFGVNNPFDIIYVADLRTTNSTTLTAVRLYDGVNLPAAGLTVATPNPMYIQGIYNCPNLGLLNTTNTTASAPASVACDALTLLSPHWADYGTTLPNDASSQLGQSAVNDTVNTAILTGNVPSTGSGATQYSGGLNNLPRLLEDWSSATLTLNTSLVCLFDSTWATGKYILPGTYYYSPAQRNFSFDQNYGYFYKQPPGTPVVY